MEKQQETTEIKPLGVKELAQLYGVSKAVMRNWLKPFADVIGTRIGHRYTPKQVRQIFELLDPP